MNTDIILRFVVLIARATCAVLAPLPLARAASGATWRKLACIGCAAWLAWGTSAPFAHGLSGPENVIVVVNADSWASRRIANEYVRLRGIPASHVVVVDGLSHFERIDVEQFRQRILTPVLRSIEERKLVPQIDAIVYSVDLPTTIDVRGDVGTRKLPPVLTLDASINGLTYLYPFVLAKNIRYLDLQSNLYARRATRQSNDSMWTPEEQERYGTALQELNDVGRRRRERAKPGDSPNAKPKPGPENSKPENSKPAEPKPADSKSAAAAPTDAKEAKDAKEAAEAQAQAEEQQEFAAAVEVLKGLREAHPRSADLLYNLACLEAQLGRLDDALETLDAAVEQGWFDHRHALNDPDFEALRGREAFQKVIARMRDVRPTMQPYCHFRGSIVWSTAGEPTAPNQGVPYLISTTLSTTSGRGLSVGEAVEQLRRSAAADFTRPRGTIYFPTNGDVRSTTREWGFPGAAEALEKLGVRAVVEPGTLPKEKPDVAGAVIGTAGFDWPASGSRILPGAICEHLTSFGGMLAADAGQTSLAEFLRHGAAGASGTVTEPYAIQAKFPTPYIQVAYASGLTLGEAFYQSVTGPYQLLIVGDPLCRPFATPLELKVDGVPADGEARGKLRLTPALQVAAAAPGAADPKPGAANGVPPPAILFELFVDGKSRGIGPPGFLFDLDTTKLPDGPHELVFVGLRGVPLPQVGRFTQTIVVRNHSERVIVKGPAGADLAWDQPCSIEAQAAGATELTLWFQGQQIGKIAGEKGTWQVDARTIGPGPVELQPVARMGERDVWGEPLRLTITAPPPLAARTPPAGTPDKGTWKLRVGAGEPQSITTTRGDWLAKGGVVSKSTWTLSGWLNAAHDDLYQLQLGGDIANLKIYVDDQLIDWPRGKSWWFVPMSLAAGRHELRIECSEASSTTLEVRFGGPGSKWLE